ncbi:hypothetical protein Droror1_Dr00023189 [Drosera rotundifolia]
MAAELKELRRRGTDMEELRVQETLTRQYLKELGQLRYRLTATQTTANASAASAEAAQLQCFALAKELAKKSNSLKQHEERVQILAEKLCNLQKELQVRELSQKQLKDEVMRVEHEVMEAVAKTLTNKDYESRKILDEVSSKKFKMVNKILTAKDEEIRSLKNEVTTLSARWMLKTKEIELQMEKYHKADRDLRKRVLKLEIYLQEARAQSRKLQRMVERKDQAIKELRDQLLTEHTAPSKLVEKRYFWESSSMQIFISMSVLILTVFSKR